MINIIIGSLLILIIVLLCTSPNTDGFLTNACAGLTRDSPASSVSPACLQQTFLEVGCNKGGTIYPSDTYTGWWI